MNNNKRIACKDLNELIEKKLRHDGGVLIYQYLNDIEDSIQDSIFARNLIRYYNLGSTATKNRCICPLHAGADNPTSLEFDDTKKAFKCHKCGEQGTYIRFIALMEKFSKNEFSEAKIFAANKFANMSLGFNSIADFEDQLKQLVIDRYNKTKSLFLIDYYDISLIDFVSSQRKVVSTYKSNNTNENKSLLPIFIENKPREFKLEMLDLDKLIRELNASDVITFGDFKYRIALETANDSKLIKGFETNSALNSKEALYEFMNKKYDISSEFADKYDLIAFERSNQPLLEYSDFFSLNDRVLFPFKDHQTGITVGYQARTMDLTKKTKIKYLNVSDFGDLKTNESKTYRSVVKFGIGDFLFNLYELKDKNIDRLFVTEGVADAIKLLSLGYDCISPGQANLTDHQIYLICKYFGKDIELFLFYDNDANNTGQNKSLLNAYRLHQFGFKNIKIIRTYGDLGTDITDVAVKIRNDITLKILIELWISNAYKFEPASDDALNNLFKTKLFTETQLKQIDPRNIDKININLAQYIKLIDKLNIHGRELDTFNPLLNCNDYLLELLLEKFNKLTSIDTSSKSDVEESKDASDADLTSQSIESTIQHSRDQNINDAISISLENPELECWDTITNISSSQLFILKQKFDYTTIKKIDDCCNKKQIGSIIGNIKKNKIFDISDFFHVKKAEKKSEDKVSIDTDFSPIKEDPDLMPF